jgi:molecular chaperone IbpA
MNSIDWTPLYRNSIGFDRLASMMNNAMRTEAPGAVPPYNIEVIEDDCYAITLAVAGFEQSDLDIEVNQQTLIVRGKRAENSAKQYLYQGIADGSFERKFNLAEYVQATDARLINGLLTINLKREIPEAMKPRSIPIEFVQSGEAAKSEILTSEAA